MSFTSNILNALFSKAKKPSEQEKAVNHIFGQQLYRSSQDIRDYKNALQAAESIYAPNRQPLMRLYKNIELDAHLTAIVQSRKIKAISKDFKLVSKKGSKDENEKAKAYFTGAWFQQCLELLWESVIYGHSLIQLEGIDTEGNVTAVSLVPRENVKPSLGLVVNMPGDTTGFYYTTDNWLVPCGKEDNLGLYMKAAPLVIYKQHALAAQAQFVELFGMPIRMGKVNAGDQERAKGMYEMLASMGNAGFGVMDKDDEVEFIETAKGGGHNAHQELINYLDEQLSKLIWGQTMMSDNGSSKSQGEVHERLAVDYSEFDQRLLAFAINDQLLPKLIALGLPLQDVVFEWKTPENTDALFTRAMDLLDRGYEFDAQWFQDTFNLPVTGKTEVALHPEPVKTEET